MARLKVNHANIGKFGVFIVDLTDEERPEEVQAEALCGVIQVVDYANTGAAAYCLLFQGLVKKGDGAAALDLVNTTKPCGGSGLVSNRLGYPELTYVEPMRPSTHYEPPVFMVSGDLVVDFAFDLEDIIYEDEYPMPRYHSASHLGVLLHALREINGLPNDHAGSYSPFLTPEMPLRKYFPEEIVAAKLAALDLAAGFEVPEFNHLEGESSRRLTRDAEQEGGGDEA